MIEALHLEIICVAKPERCESVMLKDQESLRINVVRQFPQMDF
jgi:hypothetical protein